MDQELARKALKTYALFELLAREHPDRYSRPIVSTSNGILSIQNAVADQPIKQLKIDEEFEIDIDLAVSPPYSITTDDYTLMRSPLPFLQINDAIYHFDGPTLRFVQFSQFDLRTPEKPRWFVKTVKSHGEPDRSLVTATDLASVTVDGKPVTIVLRDGRPTIG